MRSTPRARRRSHHRSSACCEREAASRALKYATQHATTARGVRRLARASCPAARFADRRPIDEGGQANSREYPQSSQNQKGCELPSEKSPRTTPACAVCGSRAPYDRYSKVWRSVFTKGSPPSRPRGFLSRYWTLLFDDTWWRNSNKSARPATTTTIAGTRLVYRLPLVDKHGRLQERPAGMLRGAGQGHARALTLWNQVEALGFVR